MVHEVQLIVPTGNPKLPPSTPTFSLAARRAARTLVALKMAKNRPESKNRSKSLEMRPKTFSAAAGDLRNRKGSPKLTKFISGTNFPALWFQAHRARPRGGPRRRRVMGRRGAARGGPGTKVLDS